VSSGSAIRTGPALLLLLYPGFNADFLHPGQIFQDIDMMRPFVHTEVPDPGAGIVRTKCTSDHSMGFAAGVEFAVRNTAGATTRAGLFLILTAKILEGWVALVLLM